MQQRSFAEHQVGTLYLVPTPIGNLDDMTFRAVDVLRTVSWIAAEDTRHTQKLLNHFEITTTQVSFHEHNWKSRIPQLLAYLQAGESVAQVSDAGMPSISDPGHELVCACLAADIPVVALPGASAGVTALIASGLPPQPFYFYGFLPRQAREQEQAMAQLAAVQATCILYESPHRLAKVLQRFSALWPAETPVVVCRELTKRYEEYIRGTLTEVNAWAQETDIKGEICLLIDTRAVQTAVAEATWQELSPAEHVAALVDDHIPVKEAIKQVAKLRGLKKQDVYAAYHHEDRE